MIATILKPRMHMPTVMSVTMKAHAPGVIACGANGQIEFHAVGFTYKLENSCLLASAL